MESSVELTLDLVFSLIQSEKDFPVDFDRAWKWIGYSSKQKAEEALKANLVEGIDFSTLGLKSSSGGRRAKHIGLTVEAFKMFAMMAGTSKGKEVRRYFLNCEQELKAKIEQERQDWRQRQVKGYVLDRALPWDTKQSGSRPFVAEFYEHLYRVRGGLWAKRNPHEINRPSCVGGWINKFVYDLFPGDVPKFLAEQYKTQPGNYRKYEFLTQQIGRIHLVTHMTVLLGIMRVSPPNNWDRFLKNIEKAFPDSNTVSAIQLEFDFLMEMEEECFKYQENQAY